MECRVREDKWLKKRTNNSKQNKCDYFLYILFDFFRPVLPWCLTLCMPWQKEYILCKKVPQEVSSDQPMHPVTLKFHGWMGLLCTTTLMLWVHFSKHVEIILLLFQIRYQAMLIKLQEYDEKRQVSRGWFYRRPLVFIYYLTKRDRQLNRMCLKGLTSPSN